MNRRDFLGSTCAAALFGPQFRPALIRQASGPHPVSTVIPVVGDGYWIWNEPPKNETGYLQPRMYDLKVGIELEGRGRATQLIAQTAVPVEQPEQKIESFKLETEGCEAVVRNLTPDAGQLVLAATSIARGQTIKAEATYRIQLFKQYQAFEREQFPESQEVPKAIRDAALQDSPGIQTSDVQVRRLAAKLSTKIDHPWDQAREFAQWTSVNIRPQMGTYTGVTTALRTLYGDCEEMSGVFVALCRSVGIPARLVWVPNHAWSEFYLTGHDGKGHWIPVHTACYHWFGWTGAHELVLQKGDRLRMPERRNQYRLCEDWMQWQTLKPLVRYTAELTPLPAGEGDDAGPGARRKLDTGQWKIVGDHPLDKYVRA